MTKSKGEKISEKLIGNKNAEQWTLENASDLFDKAIELSNKKDKQTLKVGDRVIEIEAYSFDFIGEIARELDSYIDVFDYLIDKFPELKAQKKRLMRNCEANCFSNAKKGNIKEASAIMNLKSNHKWTDRLEQDNKSSDGSATQVIVLPSNDRD